MIYIILYAVLFIAVNVLNVFFVNAQRNGPTYKSLALKMAAATGYMLTGVIAMRLGNNNSRFAWWILLGLFLCWIGDLFLHLWQHKVLPAIGFLGFLSAHFVFIAAFLNKIKLLDPDRSFFSAPEIIFVAAFCGGFLLFSWLIGTSLKGALKIPILLYAAVITTMLCKAAIMGLTYKNAGMPDGALAAGFAIAGAALFVMSDFSIAILMFNEKYKKNYPLKMFNMVTYFLAVLLLSALPALVK
ncbi:MAG: hypothetical protein IK108_09775 [Clostridia bacterium]|nr:hypothetical protein [Clostridia bacterium]